MSNETLHITLYSTKGVKTYEINNSSNISCVGCEYVNSKGYCTKGFNSNRCRKYLYESLLISKKNKL